MKVALVFLLLLPLAMPAPRNMFTDAALNLLMSTLHVGDLTAMVTHLVDDMGSNEREGECEMLANAYIDKQIAVAAHGTANHIGHSSVPLVCHTLQELAHFLHVKIPTVPMTPAAAVHA